MNLDTFKNHLLINGSEEASAKTHSEKIASFFRQYSEFNQANLDAFLASKLNVWCANSFNININAFKHYAKFLKLEIEIPSYHKIDKNKVKPYITDKEFYDIVSKIPIIFNNCDKTQVIAMLLFSTGLRPKEIIQLKREDFNFETKTVYIKKTKTHSNRTVVLSNAICNMLPAIFNQEPEVLNAFNIKHHHLTYIFQRINEMMGMKVKLTPYSMRHCFAHDMIKKGMKLTSLQILMGHNNPLTTLGYLKVKEDEALDDVRKLINKRRNK